MHGKNRIGYSLSSKGKRSFHTFDPISDIELDEPFYECTLSELNEAAELAHLALRTYSQLSGKDRSVFLRRIIKEVKKDKRAILKRFCLESGLTEERAKTELKRTLDQLENFAALISKKNFKKADYNPKTKNLPSLTKSFLPIGICAVFGASNFPFAYSTIGGDTAAALAAGCPVIVKSHQMHAGTGELVADCVARAMKKTGMPDGVFSNLNASGHKIGSALVEHPRIKAVGFTGSYEGGMALKKLADNRPDPIPVFAEMGSLNPVIMLPELLKNESEKWIETIHSSITNGSGQFCTKPGLLFLLDSAESRAFLEGLGDKIASSESKPMLGKSIWKSFNQKRAKILSSEQISYYESPDNEKPNYGNPSLLVVSDKEFKVKAELRKEIFGPHSTAVLFENKNSVLKAIEILEGQLTVSINGYPNDLAEYKDLLFPIERIAGRIIFNGVPTGVRVDSAQHHGGPYPATSDSRYTAVGNDSIYRFLRPVCYQNLPREINL